TGAITAGNALVRVGASNVTINGLSSGGNSLTLSNTTVSGTAGTSTILFVTGASNNTVTNCTILGSSTTAVDQAGGNVLFAALGSNNNTISGNNIGPAGTDLPTKGVMGVSFGTGSNFNTIDNNNIFDFFSPTTSVAGISVQQASNNWFITNN